MAPTAWAAPEASTAPPAPALIAGIAGSVPTVINIALIVLITVYRRGQEVKNESMNIASKAWAYLWDAQC